ncbi:MAG: hypothetical protein GC157_07365 [Frankiales bacterium]|nr:hypothetical protein [Frankiales bacterium]
MSNPSVFLYAGIIGMWALVLVPMWLRRHDEAQETRSADRFARAMGSLRRGDDTASSGARSATAREVLMPGRPAAARERQVTVSGSDHERTPAAAAAARRRVVLAVLAGLLVVWTVVTLLSGRLPRWSLAVPAALLLGFLVVAGRQGSRAAGLRRRQAHRATLAEAARAAEARYGAAEGQARRGGRVVAPAPAHEQPAARSEQVEVAAVYAEDSWNAVPTTLPTYVTAPRATRMPRVIDLTTPGSWNGAAMVEQARSSRSSAPVDEGGMLVETFEITVPRDPHVRAGVLVEPTTYADRYVEDDVEVSALADSEDLDALLDDPRTGTHGPTWRRAANG